MNEYDSNRIYDLTSTIGFNKTNSKREADCFVLNTCHIREKATEKVYDEIGRVKKKFRGLKKPLVIVSGCVAQAESEEMIKREPYIDMVIGPQSYHKIADLISDYERKKEKVNETDFDVVRKFDELQKISNSQNKISSYLTIQEGCDKFCHFCVVPYTRGPEYSRPFKQIIDEAHDLISKGVREIILLGQNVNAYNFSENNINLKLSSLIKKLNDIKSLKRIRFTTSHPKDMTEDLINCYKDCEKLMPYLHLPIQSGSDKILRLMNRKHDSKYYMSIIRKLKNVNKDIKISSDFIIGYPGETEEDFKDTIEIVQKIGFVNSYSFIFSPRPGTIAGKKKLNNLEENEKRLKEFQKILEDFQLKNNKSYFQQCCEVLIENKLNNQDQYFGRTKYMNPVIFESENCKPGDLINVKITSFNKKNLFGYHKINKQNKNVKEVSIVYGKDNSINVNIFNNKILMEIVGSFDDNLKELERVSGSKIFFRGNSIAIKGDKSSNEKVKDAIEYLIDRFKSDNKIDRNDIIASLNKDMIKDKENQSTVQPLEEVIKTPKRSVIPRSKKQKEYVKALKSNQIVMSLGPAGTGKTYLAVAVALTMLLEKKVERIILSRPAVEAGERLGFLPGDMKDKIDPYLRPLYDSLHDLFDYDKIQRKIESGIIEIAPLAFMRGRTLNNSFVILDEAQNATRTQIKMFLTRIGENSKLVVNGDPSQIDLPNKNQSGLIESQKILKGINEISIINFDHNDVIRHPLVTKIVEAYQKNTND